MQNSSAQPTLRGTPETDSFEDQFGAYNASAFATLARTLESQRDQARKEIAMLQEDLQRAYEDRNRARMKEEQKWRPQLEAANADNARLRECLELIKPMIDAIPAGLWADSDNVAIPINQALSTPPPNQTAP